MCIFNWIRIVVLQKDTLYKIYKAIKGSLIFKILDPALEITRLFCQRDLAYILAAEARRRVDTLREGVD